MQLLFETARIFIREYEIKDISAVHEYATQDVVVQYANWGGRVLEKCGFKLDRIIEGDFVQKGFLRTTLLFTLDLNTSAFPIQ